MQRLQLHSDEAWPLLGGPSVLLVCGTLLVVGAIILVKAIACVALASSAILAGTAIAIRRRIRTLPSALTTGILRRAASRTNRCLLYTSPSPRDH